MKKVSILVMALLLAAGSVFAKDAVMTGKAGDYTVEARLEKMPPVTGENTLTVRIKDAAGNPVTDKKVEVEYFMTEKMSPTRKSIEMPYMKSEAGATVQDSAYKSKLDFSMAGPWNITLKIADGEKAQKAKFHVNVK